MNINSIGFTKIQKQNFGWITNRAKEQLIPLINQKNTRIYKDARRKFNDFDNYEYLIIDYFDDTYRLYSTSYNLDMPVKTKNNIYRIMKDLFKDGVNNLNKFMRRDTTKNRSKRLTLEDFNNLEGRTAWILNQ